MEYPKLLISGDYNVFDEGWNGNGVYMCSGRYNSSVFKLPIYIGSASNKNGLGGRIEKEHIPALKRNNHQHNQPLQNGWNKHGGESGFVWWLLELADPQECLVVEQKYLDLYRPFVDEFGGFNISHFAANPMKGRKHTEEAKRKISKASRGRVLSAEARAKISYKNSHPSDETRKKKSLAAQSRSPECKEKFRLLNVGKTPSRKAIEKAREANLGSRRSEETKRKMSAALKGCFRSAEAAQKTGEAHAKTYILKSPTGETTKIHNLRKFCKENKLNYTNLHSVCVGRRKISQGWTTEK